MFGPDFLSGRLSAHAPDAIAAWRAQEQAIVARSVQRSQQYWYIFYPVGLAVALIFNGLLAGTSAFAYRALMPEAPRSEPETA
jgi:hypothetical protein